MSDRKPRIDLAHVLELLKKGAIAADPAPVSTEVCEDPKDLCFLAAALGSHTKIIVSGGKHLLKISGYRSIRVLRLRAFVDAYLH